MSKSQKSGSMKRVKAKGGEARDEKALKPEVHTEEYTVLGTIQTRHEGFKEVLENWFRPFLRLEEAVVLHRDSSGMINSFSWGVLRSIDIAKPRY